MTQQQYTPVSWQDETTSQQGTLINAERLNQMQTAHHYADGLEETDTVPTADPGVAYHKIVYCTADSTIYRWDGTQWTADIDDPTRELLEEHLADHDNPHQVTKAQVGLGNADNTSDMDKPISTATQTALNAKADKSDTYTKAQVDTALATKANDNAVVHLAGAETIPGAKTFTEVVSFNRSIGLIRHDLSGVEYGVSSGVWNSEIYRDKNDVEIGRQALIVDISKTSWKIRAKNGDSTMEMGLDSDASGPYVYAPSPGSGAPSNAVATIATLDGYLPMVRTTGNQVVAGIKTYTSVSINTSKWRIKNANEGISTVPSTQVQTQPKDIVDANDAQIYFEQLLTNVDGSRAWRQNLYGTGGHRKILHMQVEADGSGYVTVPWRTYNTANTDDVVTIGTLKASTDVVHRTGVETIGGTKTFYNTGFTEVDIQSGRTSGNIGGFNFIDGNGIARGQVYGHTNGGIILNVVSGTAPIQALHQRAYDPANTDDVATIGTLDAYTPMVRTTGNQTKAGQLILQGTTNEQRLTIKSTNIDVNNPGSGTRNGSLMSFTDVNDNWLAYFYVSQKADKTTQLIAWVRNADGTSKSVILAAGDV